MHSCINQDKTFVETVNNFTLPGIRNIMDNYQDEGDDTTRIRYLSIDQDIILPVTQFSTQHENHINSGDKHYTMLLNIDPNEGLANTSEVSSFEQKSYAILSNVNQQEMKTSQSYVVENPESEMLPTMECAERASSFTVLSNIFQNSLMETNNFMPIENSFNNFYIEFANLNQCTSNSNNLTTENSCITFNQQPLNDQSFNSVTNSNNSIDQTKYLITNNNVINNAQCQSPIDGQRNAAVEKGPNESTGY